MGLTLSIELEHDILHNNTVVTSFKPPDEGLQDITADYIIYLTYSFHPNFADSLTIIMLYCGIIQLKYGRCHHESFLLI